jgi:hypothetical protein
MDGLEPNAHRGQRIALSYLLPLVGELDEAVRLLRELHEELPHRIDIEGRLAAALAQRGDVEAQQVAERLATEDAERLRGLPTLWRARIAARLGQRDAAVRLLALAISQGANTHWLFPDGEAVWHSDPDLGTLEGYAPYDDLVRPR